MLGRFGNIELANAESVIALDAISIIVNKKNPVGSLSLPEISGLFRGLYVDWDKLDGDNVPVHIMVRDENSGTRDVFENLVLGAGQSIYQNHRPFVSNESLAEEVSTHVSAVGFLGYGIGNSYKVLSISMPGGIELSPNKASITTEDYPLSRRLYFYMPEGVDNADARDFIDFVKTDDAQKRIEEIGFIPVMIRPIAINDEGFSKRYLRATVGYQRLSTNIRFSKSGNVIDSFGMQSIARISQYMKENKGSLLLIGFYGLSEGRMAREFSAVKAKEVSAALVKIGVNKSHILVRGLGDRHLLSRGRSEKDNMKNIRVEVWFKPWFTGP